MVEVVQPGAVAPAGRPRHRLPPSLRLAHVAGLDGLRVLSTLGVVVYHVMGAILGANPTAGVILPPVAFAFFVISGFVIYRPFAAGHLTQAAVPSTNRFLLTRALRVLPLWWLAVVTYLVIDGSEQLTTPAEWIATFTLLQYLVPDVRFAIIGPAWALSVEWLFYLSVPGIAALMRSVRQQLAPASKPHVFEFGALAVLGVVCAAITPLRPFTAVLVGMALSVASIRQAITRRTPALIEVLRSPFLVLGITAAAWLLLANYPYRPGLSVQWVEQDPLIVAIWISVATVWFCAVAFGRATSPVGRALASPFMARASMLTFGVYLWHDLVLRHAIERLGLDAHLGAVMYLTLLGAISLAAVTFVLVERPCLVLRGRIFPARSKDEPAVAAAEATTAPQTAWLAGIDGLRVVAAIFILAFHVTAEENVSAGVSQAVAALIIPVFSVFFVVSGFVLYRPWAMVDARAALGDGKRPKRAPDGGIAAFWLRRALRLYPLYWVVQGIALSMGGAKEMNGLGDWIQVLALSPFPHPELLLNQGLGVIVWTLVVELGFYLVLPFISRAIAWAIDRKVSFATAHLVPLGTAFVILTYLGTSGVAGWAMAVIAGVSCCIVIGMALAAVDAWQRTTKRWIPAVKALAGNAQAIGPIVAACWAAGVLVSRGDDAEFLFRTYLGVHFAAQIVVATAIFVPAVFGPARSGYRRFLSSTPMRFLGPLTLGIYLWHYPVIRQITEHHDLGVVGLALAAFTGATLLALISDHVIQQPIDRFRRKHLGRTATQLPDAKKEPTPA